MLSRRASRDSLLIVLAVAGQRYALSAQQVIEVLPWLPCQTVALAPESVVGVINHRGRVVPIVDLCRLLAARDCPKWLASRIVVVAVGRNAERVVGLLVEGCELSSANDASLQPGLNLPDSPFLGDVLVDRERMIPLLKPDQLLSEQVLDVLCGATTPTMPDLGHETPTPLTG
ncbi:MAG: chemotaxis protein CheW [Sinobacteraceae bacterium]|nr:chemotaxis protein CheW [Nevskiaceae bacterium]